MKALRLECWHSRPQLRDVPVPDPGPGQVLVQVGGAGACHSDLHLMDEFSDGVLPWGPPFTLGHENAGWVHRIGEGVVGLEPGQRVLSQAQRTQIAARVLDRMTFEQQHTRWQPTIVGYITDLDEQLQNHLVEPEEVLEHVEGKLDVLRKAKAADPLNAAKERIEARSARSRPSAPRITGCSGSTRSWTATDVSRG